MAKRKKQPEFTFHVIPGEEMTEEQVDEVARLFANMVVRDLHRTDIKEQSAQVPESTEDEAM